MVRKVPDAQLEMSIYMSSHHTQESLSSLGNIFAWVAAEDGSMKMRKSSTTPGRGNMGVAQETVPWRCPCRPGT